MCIRDRLYRIYESNGKAIADQLCVYDETIDPSKPLTLFDPDFTWKKKTLTDFTVRELHVPVFKNGELVYDKPSLQDIRSYCKQQIDTLWDEVLRFENPHNYYVDLSRKPVSYTHLDVYKRQLHRPRARAGGGIPARLRPPRP